MYWIIIIGYIFIVALFIFIIYLQLKILYKKNIVKKFCLEIDKFKKNDLKIMGIISAFWGLFIFIYAIYSSKTSTKPIDLNQWGDYLAGFFAPLLFAWLVYGVIIQKKEFASALETFHLQYQEYINNTDAMNKQVIQFEIQQLNTWFNRNVKTISLIKDTMLKNLSSEETSIDSIALIHMNLMNDISIHKNYFNLYDDLKSILDISLLMEKHLNSLKDKKSDDEIFLSSVNDIENEYNMLFSKDLKLIKEIIFIVFILIIFHTSDADLSDYKIFTDWIQEEEDLKNAFYDSYDDSITNTIKILLNKDLQLENLDYTSGEINGRLYN